MSVNQIYDDREIAIYKNVITKLWAICAGETEHVILKAAVAGELFHAFDGFDWFGFYRVLRRACLSWGTNRAGIAV